MKRYTFTVTATLCEEDSHVTREEAQECLREWLECYEDNSDIKGSSIFEKITIR